MLKKSNTVKILQKPQSELVIIKYSQCEFIFFIFHFDHETNYLLSLIYEIFYFISCIKWLIISKIGEKKS